MHSSHMKSKTVKVVSMIIPKISCAKISKVTKDHVVVKMIPLARQMNSFARQKDITISVKIGTHFVLSQNEETNAAISVHSIVGNHTQMKIYWNQ